MGDLSELCSVIFVNTSNSNNTHKIDCIFTDKELGVTDAEYVKKLDEIINCDNLKEFLLPKLGDSGMSNWAELFFLCQSMLTHSYVLFICFNVCVKIGKINFKGKTCFRFLTTCF